MAESLRALENAARTAGLPLDQARSEGEALAATVSESSRLAFVDWGRQTGHTTSQEFFDAASRGRRWRAAPTVLLEQLRVAGSPHTELYARALAGVSAAAGNLGEPTTRAVGNAALAASAQLNAARTWRPPPVDRAATPVSDPLLPTNPVLAALRLTQDNIADLSRLGLGHLLEPLNGAAPPTTLPDQPAPGPQPNPEQREGPGQPGSSAASGPTLTTGAAGAAGKAEPARPLEELLAELDSLIGLRDVKAEIHRQVAVLRVEGLRTKAGLRSPTITRHLIFVGNPGTGKTTVARLVGGIYRALGLLSKGQLIEVDRSELVAGYLGQTAMKTADVVKSAEGGVLFIDEAYSLAGDQYGQEAVDTLVKEMEDKRDDLVLIVAGYPDPMALFIAQNPGLSSRFRTTIEFDDYSDPELVDIFTAMASAADYDVSPDCLTRFSSILATTPRGGTFGNGRFARNCLEAAIGHHAWRLRDVAEPTLRQLRELLPEDLDPDEPAPEAGAGEPITAAGPAEPTRAAGSVEPITAAGSADPPAPEEAR
nr:AAA family ATPase [Microlunatus panaciterrae]